MTFLMVLGALGMGISIDSVVKMLEFGVTTGMVERLTWSLCLLAGVVGVTVVILHDIGNKVGGPTNPFRKMLNRIGTS